MTPDPRDLSPQGPRWKCSWIMEGKYGKPPQQCGRDGWSGQGGRPPIPLCWQHEAPFENGLHRDVVPESLAWMIQMRDHRPDPYKDWVYFVRRKNGDIKIGFSTSPASRIGSLITAHGPLDVLAIIP